MADYDHIAPYYEALFPARDVQLDFFEQARPQGAPARWADVPCGAGAHLEGLADRGLEVRLLDPAGLLLIQIVNFDRILPELPASLPRIERALPDGRPFALERRFTPSQRDGCLLFETRLETPDGVHERTHELRALTRERLGGLLEDAGWASVSWYGDYTRVPWDPASPATIAEARPA